MIPAPNFSANAGIYDLQWEEEGVRVHVDRIFDSRRDTTGEITVRYKAPGGTSYGHLHQARLSLTSTSGRETLAKHLAKRAPLTEAGWGTILEWTCAAILLKHREGEPVKMVGNLPIGERAKYLEHPFLLALQPNMIYGPQGSGKTTVAAMLALQVLSKESGPANVLWLDFEWCDDEVNSLVKRLKEGMGLDPDLEMAYRFCSQPLADDILSIQKLVIEKQAQLVVVDSVGAACGGDPMAPDVVLRYFAALRSLRVTTLSLDHTAKINTGPFGSVYKSITARNIWEAVKGCNESDSMAVGLHHRKMNSGPLLKPFGFKFKYTDDSIIPQKTDARAMPEVLATMALADQIEAALLRQAMTPAELAVELGKTPAVMSTTISRHKGRFVSCGNGRWGVKATEVNS